MSDNRAAITFKHGLERIAEAHTTTGKLWPWQGWRIKCVECGHRWPCGTREMVTAALRDGQDELMEGRGQS